jgi:hypothetical protein
MKPVARNGKCCCETGFTALNRYWNGSVAEVAGAVTLLNNEIMVTTTEGT